MKRSERLEFLMGLAAPERRARLARLSPHEQEELATHWHLWARTEQLAPPGAWRTWLIMAGRGFGKTRAGAEWVRERAEADPLARIALVGATLSEVARGHGRRRKRPAGHQPGPTPAHIRTFFAAADLGQRCAGPALFGRRTGIIARPAAQPRLVR